jgi:hypothetical protein
MTTPTADRLVNQEITSPFAGTVRRIGKEDQTYAVGTLVAEITES